ncbi:hypothetical protein Tco_0074259 [Tanacetum coccineum]
METENAQSKGRTREMVDEDKEFDEDRLSTEDGVSNDKERVSNPTFKKVSTDRTNTVKKFQQLESDEELARKSRRMKAEEERNKIG